MKPYYFGIYHWRRRFREAAPLPLGLVLAAFALLLPLYFAIPVIVIAILTASRGVSGVRKLIKPRPWAIDQEKYDVLEESLRVKEADTLLDIGCGTGRSLVGLAPYVGDQTSVIGIDYFDNQIILGNSPGIASRNTSIAELDADFVRGDARSLPMDKNSVDRITVTQVLHDLPQPMVAEILAELKRVCTPDGRIGLIELPLIDDEHAVDNSFWAEQIEEAEFEILSIRHMPWKGTEKRTVAVASPSEINPSI